MIDNADQDGEPEWLTNLPLRSEEIGFAPDELITCANCGQATAPNRATCLYCGTPRDGLSTADKFDSRAIEAWEMGFNVVLVDASGADIEKAADVVAEIVPGDREPLKEAFEIGKQIPLLRVASAEQGERVRERLDEFGIKIAVVDDEELQTSSPPVRLRSMGFEGDRLDLGLFNLDEVYPVAADDLVLIVVGTIIEERREAVERRKLRGSKMLDEAATSSDEPVVDLYSKDDQVGWRIPARGFDFSCLGAAKSLVVGDNMRKLITKLVDFAPHASLVDDYSSVRSLIEPVWPCELRREGRVLRRRDVSTVFITNNAAQFTKYSRMQRRLLYEKKV